MSRPVDVLAVLDELQMEFATARDDLIAARAAVAKLIDAAQDALFALGSCEEAIDADRGFGWSIARLAAEGEAPEYAALLVALAEARGAA